MATYVHLPHDPKRNKAVNKTRQLISPTVDCSQLFEGDVTAIENPKLDIKLKNKYFV